LKILKENSLFGEVRWLLKNRILNQALLDRVMSSDEAAMLIRDGMTIGTSGFTPSGYPKAIPLALIKRIKESGECLNISMYTGASVGDELDGELARAGVVCRRLPYQTNNSMRDCINSGDCEYIDQHLSLSTQFVRSGFLGKVDVAVVEAVAITEEGHIIPTTSIGNSQVFVEMAEKVIVEINTCQPMELWGFSDVYVPENPPARNPIPLYKVDQRIGKPYIECGIDKIEAIVFTDLIDDVRPFAPLDDVSEAISGHLIDFLEQEVKAGRLPKNLLPMQSGVGSVANAVLGGLARSNFENLTCYTEVIQDSMLDLLDSGKVVFASGTSISPSLEGLTRFKNNINFYKDKIVLRPQEISNNPEVIRRLGIIAMNTAIEVDLYGNVNSTHIMGSKMMNGIGGSGDFARSAYISIFTTASTAKNGKISSIVPMVSHHDHVEHDVMIVVTEQGVADLRGKSPKERAKLLINNCAHPDFKPMLKDYFDRAVRDGAGMHTPHIISEALSWHDRFLKTGTMKI
jgi:succinyl-CoA:acetate CoA-transferase